MGSIYLSRLTQEARQTLVEDLLVSQSGNCFICGKEIDLALHVNHIDIDHVEPLKVGGKDGPANFAVTHESCNRSKQASDLRVARVLARFDTIAESIAGDNRPPNLGDVLSEFQGARHEIVIDIGSWVSPCSTRGAGGIGRDCRAG